MNGIFFFDVVYYSSALLLYVYLNVAHSLTDLLFFCIGLDQGCATFLFGGPYNKTSDIKRATLKI